MPTHSDQRADEPYRDVLADGVDFLLHSLVPHAEYSEDDMEVSTTNGERQEQDEIEADPGCRAVLGRDGDLNQRGSLP